MVHHNSGGSRNSEGMCDYRETHVDKDSRQCRLTFPFIFAGKSRKFTSEGMGALHPTFPLKSTTGANKAFKLVEKNKQLKIFQQYRSSSRKL